MERSEGLLLEVIWSAYLTDRRERTDTKFTLANLHSLLRFQTYLTAIDLLGSTIEDISPGALGLGWPQIRRYSNGRGVES